jgi:hypothetical protein
VADADTETTITSGELFRAVSLIREDIRGLRAAIDDRPDKDDLKAMREALEAKIAAVKEAQAMRDALQDKAINALEGWQTWALRLGGPAVIAALLGVVFNASRITGG